MSPLERAVHAYQAVRAARCLSKFRFPQAEYEEATNQRDFECLTITYRSGGLRIVGFIYKPKHTSGRKLPTIIFNRGGAADFSASAPEELVTFYFWAKEGFVVLASNYRGGGGSEASTNGAAVTSTTS